ncbi:tyrosine-protein phosphatase non-receptor type 22 isoform X2 [Antennarius striatus]|uniref:tyrosine-protein phosphatase non-receptor type 22 isoform X2 n=1 Tax=Antennarius striatus TaxID=241820 RepID=UPI0035AE411B
MEHQACIVRQIQAQLEEQETPNGIAEEFVRLKSQSNKYRTDKTYPTKTAEKQENVKKNRYKDIVPFDHSRVKLSLHTSKNDADYINASFIQGVSGSRAYIATQGPLPHTILDFFRMIWEYEIKVVVMACREFEMGKKKCERYWPQKEGQPFVCEPFTVYCDSTENRGDFLIRTLQLNYNKHIRTLKQLHYVNWPDHGVPDSIPPILDMLEEMRTHQPHEDVPICIHCSAGCGRTGALCVIDYTWNLLKNQMITSDFSIFNAVQNMRTQRPSLVQTKEQYELVYTAIKLLFDRYLQDENALTHREEPETENKLSDLNEESDVLLQFQHQLDEERHVVEQNHTSKYVIDLKVKDMNMDQKQWQQLQTPSDASIPKNPPKQLEPNQRAPDVDKIQDLEGSGRVCCPPPPGVAAAICLMVEDPYFDGPVSSPSEETPIDSIQQVTVNPIYSTPAAPNAPIVELNCPAPGLFDADEDEAPPLPQRTPESYVLAKETELPDLCERLMVILPINPAAETISESRDNPPSPVPPLPERTPDSFELAADPDPVEQRLRVTPAANLRRLGMSSEWSGNTNSADSASQIKMEGWARSKSLKGKMTFKAAVTNPNPSSTSSLHPHTPPQDPNTALLPQTVDLTHPLPDRTPESSIHTTQEAHKEATLSPLPLEMTHPSSKFGLSSEWDGTSQPIMFLDVKIRSKSVRVKGSKRESLTAVQHHMAPPLIVGESGAAQIHVNTELTGSDEKATSKSKPKLPHHSHLILNQRIHLLHTAPHFHSLNMDLGSVLESQRAPGAFLRHGFEFDPPSTSNWTPTSIDDHQNT